MTAPDEARQTREQAVVIFKRVGDDRYSVEAGGVVLGHVVRSTRSTDSTVGGRGGRLRRPGKGAVVWHAEVPREQWDHPRHSQTNERLASSPRTAGQLAHCYGGGYRLEQFGQRWDRRREAAEALAAWQRGARESKAAVILKEVLS